MTRTPRTRFTPCPTQFGQIILQTLGDLHLDRRVGCVIINAKTKCLALYSLHLY